MKRILITGCCGFIGSHLGEKLLLMNYEIWGIDNFDNFYDKEIKQMNLNILLKHSSFHFFECDLRDSKFYESFSEGQFDAVIHLAAKVGVLPSVSQPLDYINSNISATTNLLNFMISNNIRKLLFASSSSVYGNSISIPFNEELCAVEPISPYAFTKRSCELLNFTYHHLYDIDVINLRLFTVYGPRQRPDLAIHKFVKLMSSNQNIKIYGDGSTSRDYTHIDDIVDGFLLALDYAIKNHGVCETVNLGSTNPVPLLDLISIIARILKKTPKLVYEEAKQGDVSTTYADISKAKALFNYQPSTDILKGITTFIRWYEETYDNRRP